MHVEMLERLRLDPGTRTLGELLQERQWAVTEIERLRSADASRGHVRFGGKSVTKTRTVVADARLDDSGRGARSPPASQLLRLPEVSKLIGLSRSSVYLMIARGEFPSGIRVGARARRWRLSDISAWQDKLDQ